MAQSIPQQAGEITPQQIQEGIIQMKKSLSQIEGECNTMRSDAQSNIFINMANVCGRLVQQVDQLKRAKQEFAIDERNLEETIKACIIMRLIGVYNISLMDSMDQAKVLSLLFKVVATPIGITDEVSILTKLEKAL